MRDAGDPGPGTAPTRRGRCRAKGEKQAERLGRFLAGIGFRPDAILSSPKLRASQTAEIVAGQLGVPVTLDERLAGGVDEIVVEAILRDAGDPRRVVLVGPRPGLQRRCVQIAVRRPATCEMKKGALARIDVERPVAGRARRRCAGSCRPTS